MIPFVFGTPTDVKVVMVAENWELKVEAGAERECQSAASLGRNVVC